MRRHVTPPVNSSSCSPVRQGCRLCGDICRVEANVYQVFLMTLENSETILYTLRLIA